mgnify:CR=1 FL=1
MYVYLFYSLSAAELVTSAGELGRVMYTLTVIVLHSRLVQYRTPAAGWRPGSISLECPIPGVDMAC